MWPMNIMNCIVDLVTHLLAEITKLQEEKRSLWGKDDGVIW